MLFYARLRPNGPVHLVKNAQIGTRSICGRFVPVGSEITVATDAWEQRPCARCKAKMLREARKVRR